MARGKHARVRRRVKRAASRSTTLGVSKAQDQAAEALVAGASGDTGLPLSDRNVAWDAGAAEKSLDPDQFGAAHFWYIDGKPRDQIGSYKLPFAKAGDGGLQAVWRGVTAGAARLSSTKGVDAKAVQSKMGAYYAKARKQFDDPGIKAPWEAALENESPAFAMAYAELGSPGEDWSEEFTSRHAYWESYFKATGQYAPPPDADGDDDGDMGACANCDHSYAMHPDGGACSVEGCDCTSYENAMTAAASEVVWEPKNGFQALSGGIASTLNEPNSWRWYVSDVALSADRAMLVDGGTNTNWVASFSRDGDGKPVLAPQGEWIPAEQEWVRSSNEYARANYKLLFESVTADGAVAPSLPAEHQPGETLPKANPSPDAPTGVPLPTGQLSWTATLCPEGKATDDGRIFAPGSITWRELPLSLMAMTQTADGHDGAEIAGRIDRIWRENGLIRAEGVFDSGDFGREIARLVTDGTLRGVSVDIAPQKVEIAYRSQVVDENGYWKEPDEAAAEDDEEEQQGPSLVDLLLGNPEDEVLYVVREAVLGMATVCPFQAFADATIEAEASLAAAASPMVWTVTMQAGWSVVAKPDALTASAAEGAEETPVLTASAAGLAPAVPPPDWFADPELPELTALTVTPEGRVYGHAAPWGLCHIGLPNGCTTAPASETGYAYFHLKEVECEDGGRVPCGTITLDTGHAHKDLSRVDATAHYDDTGTAVADVVVGEDEFGIWVAGALRADVDAETARKLRGAALSGDWRTVNGNLELVALLAVNVPGFPIPRPTAALVASGDGWEPTALIAAGVHMGLNGLTAEEREAFEQLRRDTRPPVTDDDWAEVARLAGK